MCVLLTLVPEHHSRLPQPPGVRTPQPQTCPTPTAEMENVLIRNALLGERIAQKRLSSNWEIKIMETLTLSIKHHTNGPHLSLSPSYSLPAPFNLTTHRCHNPTISKQLGTIGISVRYSL